MNRKILNLAICSMALVGCGNCSSKVSPLAFERGMKSGEAPNRPQEPKLPLPYIEEHVSNINLEAGVTLSGTLTLPTSKGPFPVVLLIAGSGPIDRDETVFGHKPFLVLADYLTRQGIAVLRFDKRGCGKSTGNYVKATSQDFSDDVLAGIAYIKSRKEVNLNQIAAEQLQEIAKNYMATLAETQEKVTLEYLKSITARVNTEWLITEWVLERTPPIRPNNHSI